MSEIIICLNNKYQLSRCPEKPAFNVRYKFIVKGS